MKKFYSAAVAAMAVCAAAVSVYGSGITPAPSPVPSAPINIGMTVDETAQTQQISPYIYGINGTPPLNQVTATAYRQGGNRMTGYNWETNASNAGTDWHNNSDSYLVPAGADASQPAVTVTNFAQTAKAQGGYALVTVPMAGYVAADMNGPVTDDQGAPSERWDVIADRKSAPLSLTPDLNDGTVYTDEFIHYLITKLGGSTAGGIDGYSLDNEPSLWPSTHPLLHPSQTTVAELLAKSASVASVIKDQDANAEVFGPVLYGYGAYIDFQGAPDWSDYSGQYKWFVDAYLAEMKKADDAAGRRLLDVFDIHYYSEARGATGRVTDVSDKSDDTRNARMQATRTLWDSSYAENSWIAQWFSKFLPVLPTIQASIASDYPGTKLALTEYNFGGGDDISGGIAEADALGIFGKYGVYMADLWPLNDKIPYDDLAINLFTNYDGKGAEFGGTSVGAATDDAVNSSVYASTDSDGLLHLVLLNKNVSQPEHISLTVNSPTEYGSYTAYGFDGSAAIMQNFAPGTVGGTGRNQLTYDLPAMTAVHLTLTPAPQATPTPAPTAGPTATAAATVAPTPAPSAPSGMPVLPIVIAAVIIVGAAGLVARALRKWKKK